MPVGSQNCTCLSKMAKHKKRSFFRPFASHKWFFWSFYIINGKLTTFLNKTWSFFQKYQYRYLNKASLRVECVLWYKQFIWDRFVLDSGTLLSWICHLLMCTSQILKYCQKSLWPPSVTHFPLTTLLRKCLQHFNFIKQFLVDFVSFGEQLFFLIDPSSKLLLEST